MSLTSITDFKEIANNMVFFTATLWALDMTGLDESILRAFGSENSEIKRALATASIMEGVLLLGKAIEGTSLDKLQNVFE